nr:MAG TPA: hypothetical protein [Caudoviricetes sp.]
MTQPSKSGCSAGLYYTTACCIPQAILSAQKSNEKRRKS